MEIVWLGHSCFRLRARDITVVTDPFDKTLGFPLGKLLADVVTVSHQHPHHSHVGAVSGNPRIVDGPGEYEIAGVAITGVATSRGRQAVGGPPAVGTSAGRARNTAYRIEIDDLTVCHLGDLGNLLSTDQVELLQSSDVLLIPVGGHCTIDAAQAAEVVSQLEPRIVIPMHYRTEAAALPLDNVDRFCREMGVEEWTPQPRLAVARSSLPQEPTVVVLDHRG